MNAQTNDQGGVAGAVEELRQAMVSRDRAVLERLVGDELTYGHTSGRTEDRTKFIEGVTSGKSAFTEISVSQQVITLHGDCAIVHHVFKGKRLGGNEADAARELGNLLVWVRKSQQWKLVARQSVVVKRNEEGAKP